VRFHAAQSIITFGGLHVIRAVLGGIFGVRLFSWWHLGRGDFRGVAAAAMPILSLIGLLTFVLWIVLMVKAYQGQKFKLPLAGDLAEDLAGR
jgi:uncharacterized membrane protein